MITGENIVCFAGEDWWYHNPHSNLHIMKAMAKSGSLDEMGLTPKLH